MDLYSASYLKESLVDHSKVDLIKEILNCGRNISTLAAKSNTDLIPNSKFTVQRLESYSDGELLSILSSIGKFNQVCQLTVKNGNKLNDTKSLMWSAFQLFGLYPPNELMNMVSDGEVTEIYNLEGLQIFRNLAFLDICSYSVADLFAYPWWELFERNEEMMTDIMIEVTKILNGDCKTPFVSNINSHLICESFSELEQKMEMKFTYFSPVFSRASRSVAGFVCSSKAKVVYQRSEKQVSNNRPGYYSKPSLVVSK